MEYKDRNIRKMINIEIEKIDTDILEYITVMIIGIEEKYKTVQNLRNKKNKYR